MMRWITVAALLLLALCDVSYAQFEGYGPARTVRCNPASTEGIIQNCNKPWVSVGDFAAKCDGVTNDSVAIQALLAAGGGVTPYGAICNDTTDAASALIGIIRGYGQVKDSASNTRAPFFSQMNAPPSSTCNASGGVDIAFNCDLSHVQFALEHRITGAATLGQPTSGYLYTPNAYPHYSQVYSSSGFNNSTSGNAGRTAAVDYMSNVFNAGQGDMVSFNAECSMGTQTRAGATQFLASPACVLFNGGAFAGAAGQFLSPSQYNMQDNGNDVAALGMDIASFRTVNTGGLGAFWGAFVSQSSGTKPVDYAYAAYGTHNVGVDFTTATFAAGNQSAIVVKGGDRFYRNGSSSNTFFATAVGTTYDYYDTVNSCYRVVVGNLVNICLDTGGHVRASGAAPTPSTCGTTPSVSGSDIAGVITMGTGTPTACTVTFAVAYLNPPYCVVTWQTNLAAMSYTVTTSTITLAQTATSSNKVNYHCEAQAGG